MRMLRWWVLFGSLACTPAYADGISGTYVGRGSHSAFLVQIVETTAGQLTGRYEQTILQATGKLDTTSASITGASDGHTVVVTLKYSGFLTGGMTASGSIEGNILHLAGEGDGGNINLNLARSDELSYRTQFADLEGQAKRIVDNAAKARVLTRLNELTDKMLRFAAAADGETAKFPPIEQHYRTITEMMNAALARQRMIFGIGQAGVARSQIGVAINQASVEAEQVHTGMQSADQGIGGKVQNLAKEVAEIAPNCRSSAPGQDDTLREACSKFHDAHQKVTASAIRLAEAFQHTERIWIEEHRKQQAIIQASDIASR